MPKLKVFNGTTFCADIYPIHALELVAIGLIFWDREDVHFWGHEGVFQSTIDNYLHEMDRPIPTWNQDTFIQRLK